MARNIVFFITSGEQSCFEHTLMKVLELHEKGNEVGMVVDGVATSALTEYSKEGRPCYKFYQEARRAGLIKGVCKECAVKFGNLNEIKRQKLPILENHPDPESFRINGFEVLFLIPKACNYCETWDTLSPS